MGGRQIGNRTIDNSYQNQSGVASLHREDNGHHTHACKGHHKEIPVAHVKLLGNTSGQAGGNDARNAVAGNNHAALDRAETDALDIFIGPGSKAYADKHEHKSAGAQKKLLFIGKETNQLLSCE